MTLVAAVSIAAQVTAGIGERGLIFGELSLSWSQLDLKRTRVDGEQQITGIHFLTLPQNGFCISWPSTRLVTIAGAPAHGTSADKVQGMVSEQLCHLYRCQRRAARTVAILPAEAPAFRQQAGGWCRRVESNDGCRNQLRQKRNGNQCHLCVSFSFVHYSFRITHHFLYPVLPGTRKAQNSLKI